MGKAKKLRTMQTTVNAIMRHELSKLDSYVDRVHKKKFDVLVRSGIVVRDGFDDFNWITI